MARQARLDAEGTLWRKQDERHSAGLAALRSESIPKKQREKKSQQLKLVQRRVKTA